MQIYSMNAGKLVMVFMFCLLSVCVQAESVWVDDPPYNAAGDGVTDDSTAIQNALNDAAIQSGVRGGTVYLGGNKTYLVSSNLVMPAFTSLVGDYEYSDTATNINWQTHSSPKLKISSSKTIEMWGGCALRGLILIRNGLNGSETNSSSFGGTAVTMYRGDTTIENCAILGFGLGIYADPTDGISKQRVRLYDLNIDCLSGVKLLISKDISKMNDIHCYPYLTSGQGSGALRSGVGIWIGQDVDWPWLSDCYVYGYDKGYMLDGNTDSVHSAVLNNCVAEAPLISGATACSHGFENRGDNQANKFYQCKAVGYNVGFRILPDTGRTSLLYDVETDDCDMGVLHSQGHLHVHAGTFTGLSTASSKGVVINNSSARASIRGNSFDGLNIGIDDVTRDQFVEAHNTFVNVNTNIR